jgi:hypothetical protein
VQRIFVGSDRLRFIVSQLLVSEACSRSWRESAARDFRRLEHAKAAGDAFQRAREDDASSNDPILKSKAPFGTNDLEERE